MTFSLYAANVPSCQQNLSAVMRMLDKAEAFCGDQEIAPNTIVEARLAENMLPFAYQVKSTVVHSLGAIMGVHNGMFSPDTSPPPADFATLKGRITETLTTLAAIDPAEIDGFVGRDIRFALGDHRAGHEVQARLQAREEDRPVGR